MQLDVGHCVARRAGGPRLAHRLLLFLLLPRPQSVGRLYRGHLAARRRPRDRPQTAAHVCSQHGAPEGAVLEPVLPPTYTVKCTNIKGGTLL